MRVAERVFLRSGFAATTMQAVAVEAGASKETLYRHFGNKEELFAEVVSNRSLQLRAILEADFDGPTTMEAVLRELGTRVLTHMSGPDVMGLLRIVVAEVPRDPEIGRIFFANAPERTQQRLAQYLNAAHERDEFHGDADLAASIFLTGIVGTLHLVRLTVQDAPLPDATAIKARVEAVVAMFMKHYGTPA